MTQSCKRNIFLYNKQDELMTYVELDPDGNTTGYYSLKDRVLTRYTIFNFKEKNKMYSDKSKSKITYGEDCKLFHMFFDQEDSYCKVVKKGSSRIELPTVLSTIHLNNENQFEGYTINPSLIQDWLKKL
jgi:hypothetical protein